MSTELTANNLSRDFRIEGNSKTAERISRRDKTREVAVQSFLYCAGYLATYFVTFIMGVSGLENNSDHMGKWWFELLLVLRGVTFPFQGFFNFCAYMRPKYMQWREIQLYRDVVPSRWKALRGAMNAEPLPDSRTLRLMKRSYIARTQQSSRDDEDARMSESGPQGLSTTHEETAAENNSARTISCTEALCRRIGLPGSGNTRPSSVVTSTVSTESEAPRQIKGQLGPDSLTRLSMEYDDENLAKIPSPSHAETLNFEEAKDNSILQRMVVDMGNPITASDVGPTISEDSSAMTP